MPVKLVPVAHPDVLINLRLGVAPDKRHAMHSWCLVALRPQYTANIKPRSTVCSGVAQS
jgi:hypothetical protein